MTPPRQDDDLALLKRELEGPRFHALLRPEAVSADRSAGTVAVRLEVRAELGHSPAGTHLHGGVIAALIDLAGHAAVAIQVGHVVPTIDLRIDYLRPAGGKAVLARARVLQLGRSFARADVEIEAEDGRLVAVGRGTFATLASHQAPGDEKPARENSTP